MAAPTQEYPPWLSQLVTTLTDAAGVPTATSATVLQFPLTYYGPSIPLGTDGAWVYGGLTSPAPSTSTPSAATTTPLPTTTSATPSLSPSPTLSTSASSAAPSSSQALSSSSTPTSSLSSLASSASSASPSSASASSTAAAAGGSAGGHSDMGRILGIALGITGGLLLLLALIGILVCCRRRRNRRTGTSPAGGEAPWHWHQITEEEAQEARAPGEGSPRGSGEEHDPFLRASVAAGAAEASASDAYPREKDQDGQQPARLVDPAQRGGSVASSLLPFAAGAFLGSWGRRKPAPVYHPVEKSSSAPEAYRDAEAGTPPPSGNAARRSVAFNVPPTSPPQSPTPARSGRILSREELARLYPDPPASPRSPRSPRSPPPLGVYGRPAGSDRDPLIGSYDDLDMPPTDMSPQLVPSRSRSNYSLGRSSRSGSEHEAIVHTARRVRLDDRATARNIPTETYPSEVMANRSWAQRVGLASDFNELAERHPWLAGLVGRGRSSMPSSPLPTLDSRRGSQYGQFSSPNPNRSASRTRPNSYAGGLASMPGSPEVDPAREARLSPVPPRLREMGMLRPDLHRPVSTATAGSAKSNASGGTIFYDASSRAGTPGVGGTMSTESSRRVPVPPVPALPAGVTAPLRLRSREGLRPRGDSEPPAYSLAPPPSAYTTPFHTPAEELDDAPPRPASPFATASTATAHSRAAIPSALTMPAIAAWDRPASGSGSPTDSGLGSQEITIDVLEDAPPSASEQWGVMRRAERERPTTFGGAAPAGILTRSADNIHESRAPSLHHLSPHGNRDGSGSHSSGTASTRAHSHEHSGSGSVSSQGHRLAISPPLSAVGHRHHRTSTASAGVSPVSTSPVRAATSVPGSSIGSSVTTHQSARDARGGVLHFPLVPSTMGLAPHREDAAAPWDGSWGSPEHLRALQYSSGSGSDEAAQRV